MGTSLTLITGNTLDPFEAVDDDAGIYGDITFEVTSDTEDHTRFEMYKLSSKQSELRVLAGGIEERTYTVRALRGYERKMVLENISFTANRCCN